LPARSVTAQRLLWVHVPKCGTPFGNIIARAGCTAADRVTLAIMWQPARRDNSEWPPDHLDPDVARRRASRNCSYARLETAHRAVSDQQYGWGARLVTMLRTPCERTVSGFFAQLHSCESMKVRLRVGFDEFYSNFTEQHVREYASCVSACAVNLLTGRPCGNSDANESTAATAERRELVSVAIRHLREDFFFVGLVSQWNTSVRLFARMTNTTVKPSDFVPSHVSRGHPRKEEVSRLLCSDHHRFEDQRLYQAATTRFHEDLATWRMAGER